MKLASVYGAVVLIWSTTPLGIRFSVESLDFIQALAIRMWISLFFCLLLLKIWRLKLKMTRTAIYSYSLGAMAITGAMLCVYWASEILPSGLVAVVWGLTPMVVFLQAWLLLKNAPLNCFHFFSMALAVLGLYVIFAQQLQLGQSMMIALLVLLLGVNLHSLSSVLLQRLQMQDVDAGLHPLVQTTGALLLSAPVYALVWWMKGSPLPLAASWTSIAAIAYLAIFGSVLGFIAYFYLLNNMSAANVSLITLITPVIALLLGTYLAGEVLQSNTWVGAALIMLALVLYQQQAIRNLFSPFMPIKIGVKKS